MPDILTNRDADFHTCHINNTGGIALTEIALLIENLVVGEPLLEVLGNHLTAMQNTGRVVQSAVASPRVSDNHVKVSGKLARKSAQRIFDLRLQAVAHQKVFRGITGQCQLRKHDKGVLTSVVSLARHLNYFLSITLDVTNKGIELPHDNFHAHTLLTKSLLLDD